MLETKRTRTSHQMRCDGLPRVVGASMAPVSAEGARGRASGRVQKQRNNGATRRRDVSLKLFSEPSRWARMDWLRVNSARHGQRMCGMSAAVDEVTVQRGKSGVSFGGLLTCGSRTCPNCGPRIAAQTRTDIERAVSAWVTPDQPKHKIWFGTFTIRHSRGQSFEELAAAVTAVWKAATNGRGWRNDRMQHGIEHHMRVFEQKWSRANGWHIHVHALFFIDDRFSAAGSDHTPLLATMFKRWAAKAVALGFGVPLIRAQDLHEVTGLEALDRVAGYFAKETTDASGEHPGSIAAEMSNGAGKQGITSLTPGQILAWAMEGEGYIEQLWGAARSGEKGRGVQGLEYARLLYAEFERGMKGRRTIAWSQGMREALGLGAELTDAEMAERAEALDAVTRDTLVSMTGQAWRKFVARPGRRAELYAVAQTLTPDDLVDWLSGFGVHALPHRRDRSEDRPEVVFEYSGPTPF